MQNTYTLNRRLGSYEAGTPIEVLTPLKHHDKVYPTSTQALAIEDEYYKCVIQGGATRILFRDEIAAPIFHDGLQGFSEDK